MLRKMTLLCTLATALFSAQPTEARRHMHCRTYRTFVRPAPVVYMQQPCYYYYPQPYAYYPAQPYVGYVDYRKPEIAAMQDGINFFFNAISCSRL